MNYTKSEQAAITRALNIISEKTAKAGTMFNDPTATQEYFTLKFAGADREHFMVAFLNSQHGLIACETLFSGTLDGAAVYPRVVVKRALELNAAAVIFAHNHPSGNSEPSSADRKITERLVSACALIDIRVLDHMIIGDNEYTSFAMRGLL